MVWRVVYFGFLLRLAVFCVGLITLLWKRSVMCMSWHTWFFSFRSFFSSNATTTPHHRMSYTNTLSLTNIAWNQLHHYFSFSFWLFPWWTYIHLGEDDDDQNDGWFIETGLYKADRGKREAFWNDGIGVVDDVEKFSHEKKLHRAKRACILSKCSLLWCLHVQCTVSFMNKWNKCKKKLHHFAI